MKAFNLHAVLAAVAVSTALALVAPKAFAADTDDTEKNPRTKKTQTAVLASDAKEKNAVPNAKNREDIDDEITNAKLRAATGAKSLFSFQSAVSWYGGSIKQPFGKDRPQLSPGTIENDPAKITASISGKYRVTDHDNLNVGFGRGWLTPFYDGQKGHAEDPYVAYGRVFKAWGLQNVSNIAGTVYTTDSSRNRKDLAQSDIDHTILWAIPHSRWQLGLNVAWEHEFYSGETPVGMTAEKAGQRLMDTLAAFPFAEYEFNNTYSFRTVYRGITYYNSKDAASTFVRDTPTQSLGLGVAITRDIYIYPNIQWVWEDIRADKTDVAINANINL